MAKRLYCVILLCASVLAQTSDQSPSTSSNQKPSKTSKGEITVTGCVSKMSTHFVLMVTGEGNSYLLEETKKLKIGPYLGQEVEVAGQQSPTINTSSDNLRPAGSVKPPVTITVRSVKTIASKCPAN